MGANHVELPEFINGAVVERMYQRAIQLQDRGERDPQARSLLVKGMNMARAGHPAMAKVLDFGAEHLRKLNDEQQSRIEQHGYRRCDFTEFASWREAYLRVVEPKDHEDVRYRVYGWIFAAVAEVLSA